MCRRLELIYIYITTYAMNDIFIIDISFKRVTHKLDL